MLYKLFFKIFKFLSIANVDKYYLYFLKLFPKFVFSRRTQNVIRLMGIDFPNRVGITISDNIFGDYLSSLSKLGFGFVEIDVSSKSNSGLSLINRVNNLLVKLKNSSSNSSVIGVYIKSTNTEYDLIYQYVICMRNLYLYVDYIVLSFGIVLTDASIEYSNIYKEHLVRLKQEQKFLTESNKRYIPIVIEIVNNLSEKSLLAIIHEIVKTDIDGIVISFCSVEQNIDANRGKTNCKFVVDNIPNTIPVFFKGQLKNFIANKEIISRSAHLSLFQDLLCHGSREVKNITR